MIKYPKIETLLDRDFDTHKVIEGSWRLPEFEYLKWNAWLFTEKVDGTNIRVIWDGERVRFSGRTDRAQIPTSLLNRLLALFPADKLSAVFGGPVCLYGEGYGEKIQKGGGRYISGGVDFTLFDIRFGDEWWLKREDVEQVAQALGCSVVPVIGEGTLLDAIALTKKGFNSAWGNFLAEGLVVRPKIQLFNRRGDMIIGKIKYKDFSHG